MDIFFNDATCLIITCLDILVHACHFQYAFNINLMSRNMTYYEQLCLYMAIETSFIARSCPKKSVMSSKLNQEMLILKWVSLLTVCYISIFLYLSLNIITGAFIINFQDQNN